MLSYDDPENPSAPSHTATQRLHNVTYPYHSEENINASFFNEASMINNISWNGEDPACDVAQHAHYQYLLE